MHVAKDQYIKIVYTILAMLRQRQTSIAEVCTKIECMWHDAYILHHTEEIGVKHADNDVYFLSYVYLAHVPLSPFRRAWNNCPLSTMLLLNLNQLGSHPDYIITLKLTAPVMYM